jgi:putative transposase
VRKKHGPLRADTLAHSMNAAKEAFVLDFIRDYRDVVVQVSRAQWRLFFETGSTNKQASAKHLNDICGAAPVQMASYQVQEQIDGWISNRANEFVDCVRGSKLPDAAKKQLYTINRRQLWFSRDAIPNVDPEARALARSIMRHVMGKHRRPDLRAISPRLDMRTATISKSKKARHFSLWVQLAVPHRKAVTIPLLGNPRFDQRAGELCPVVQLCTDQRDRVSIRLVQDMAKPFAALRAAYRPKMDSLGIDFGLATLIATSEGTMFGVGLIADLKRIDKQIVGIARHRQRSGGKARDSQRYRNLVTRVRGMLKTRINTALNRIVALHRPAELNVERLDFRLPGLSRRMNRLVTNCGRAVFRSKLADLKDKFGITATEVPAPYTSQECSLCHYVDARNRQSQSKFTCRWCSSVMHADVNGARTVNQRRSLGLGEKWLGKAAILGVLVDQHTERFPRPLGTAADPRLDNPYFKSWARGARMLETQGVVRCA